MGPCLSPCILNYSLPQCLTHYLIRCFALRHTVQRHQLRHYHTVPHHFHFRYITIPLHYHTVPHLLGYRITRSLPLRHSLHQLPLRMPSLRLTFHPQLTLRHPQLTLRQLQLTLHTQLLFHIQFVSRTRHLPSLQRTCCSRPTPRHLLLSSSLPRALIYPPPRLRHAVPITYHPHSPEPHTLLIPLHHGILLLLLPTLVLRHRTRSLRRRPVLMVVAVGSDASLWKHDRAAKHVHTLL